MTPNPSRAARRGAAAALIVAALAPAWADFEVKAPDGRTLLIKDDGTWKVVEPPADAASAPPPYSGPQAELQLVRRIDSPGGCTFALTLVNHLPYEIHNIVPDFTIAKADGVPYMSASASFIAIKPGDQRPREVEFRGVKCAEVVKLQVQRGDRCVMGDLNRFSDANGQCLARIKLQPSELLKFEK